MSSNISSSSLVGPREVEEEYLAEQQKPGRPGSIDLEPLVGAGAGSNRRQKWFKQKCRYIISELRDKHHKMRKIESAVCLWDQHDIATESQVQYQIRLFLWIVWKLG